MKLEDLEISCKKLPTFPVVAVKVLKTMKKDAFNIGEISDIISADLAFSAKMLRVANSAFYGRTAPVRTINDALMIIGIETAKNLALTFSLIDTLTIKDSDFDFEFFWKNSITAGIGAELWSKMLGYPRDNEYFLLGFLQDIGILILYNHDPLTYAKIFGEKKKTGEKLYLIEQQALSLDHQDAGGYVLKIWDFPESIYLPVSAHHNPQILMDTTGDITMAVNILNIADLVRDIYYGTEKSRKIAEFYNYTEKFSLKVEDIDDFVDTVGKRTMDVLEFFGVDQAGVKSYMEIIKEENEKLMINNTLNEPGDNIDGNTVAPVQNKDQAEDDIRQLLMTNERLREVVSKEN